MARNDENLKGVYETLKKEGYTPPAYEEFVSDMNNEDNLKGVYETLKRSGYEPPEYSTFKSDMFGAETHATASTMASRAASPATGRKKSFFKLRRGGKDFTVSTDEVNAAGGLTGWAKAHPGAPVRVYMEGPQADGGYFTGHVALEEAHKRSKQRGYKYQTKEVYGKDAVWKPTDRQKMQVAYELEKQKREASNRRATEQQKLNRTAQSVTTEGRDVMNAMEFQARAAGQYNKPLGIGTRLAPKSDNLNTEEQRGGASSLSPRVYGAKIVNGEVKTQWLLPDGSVTTDFNEADYAENAARHARQQLDFESRMRKNGLDPSKREDVLEQNVRDRLEKNHERQMIKDRKLADEHSAELLWNDNEGFFENIGRLAKASILRTEQVNYGASRKGAEDTEAQDLKAEAYTLNQTLKRIDAGRLKKSEGFASGFFNIGNNSKNLAAGVADVMTDEDFWLGGLVSANNANRLLAIDQKLRAGGELTDSELNLVYATLSQIEAETLSSTPHAYRMAQTTVEMVPFMIQMAANPASGLTKALVGKFGRAAMSKFGKAALKKIAKKYMAGKVAGTVVGDLATSAVLANTSQAAGVAGDAISRYVGNPIVDDEGKITGFDGSHDAASSIGKAEGSMIIENFTEMLGGHFGAIGGFVGRGVSAGAKKIGLGKMYEAATQMAGRIKATDWAKAIGDMERKSNWNGTLGEILEEEAGIVLNSAFVGDSELSDLVNADKQIDIALGVGFFGAHVSALKSLGYPIARHNAKKSLRIADSVGRVRFTPDAWRDMRQQIEDADDADLSTVVSDLVKSEAKSKEQAKAILDYAQAMVKMRGFALGEAARKAEGMQDPIEESMSDSYDEGYESGGEATADIQATYDAARNKVVSVLGEEMVLRVEESGVKELVMMIRDGGFDESALGDVVDFINAKSRLDGMRDAKQDGVDELIMQSDITIDSRVNRGMPDSPIVPAVMKGSGKKIYVVGGIVTASDDGSSFIKSESDSMIVVRDEEGNVEITHPEAIIPFGERMNPEEQKLMAAEVIRQQAEAAQMQQEASEQRPQFDLNDEFTIFNEASNPIHGTITGELDEDGRIEIQTEEPFNGNIVNRLRPEELEGMLDTYNGEPFGAASEVSATPQPKYTSGQFRVHNSDGTETRGVLTGYVDENGYHEYYVEGDLRRLYYASDEELDNMIAEYQPDEPQQPTAEQPQTADRVYSEGVTDTEAYDNGLEDGAASTSMSDEELNRNIERFNDESEVSMLTDYGRGWVEGLKQEQQRRIQAAQPEQTEQPEQVAPIEPTPAPTAEPTPLQRIPRDAKGEPIFEQAENPEHGWDALVEFSDGDAISAKQIADTMVEKKRKEYEKAHKLKPKGETPTEIRESQKANTAQLAQAEREYNIWQDIANVEQVRQEAEARRLAAERAEAEETEARVRAEIAEEEARIAEERKEISKGNKEMEEAYDYCRDCPDAVEILSDTEAHNAYEVAAVVLSRNRILSGSARGRKSYKDETGFGAEEQKKMFGMFASREKGGRTIEELAEDEFKATCEEFGVRYDNQEARGALIEVLSGARTRGDILNYIRRNRIAEARALVDHYIREEEAYTELLAREDFIDEMHITPEEYESYMEVAQAEAEKALENFDEIEYNSYLADELAARQLNTTENDTDRRNFQDDAAGEGAENGTLGGVVSEKGLHSEARAGESKENTGRTEKAGDTLRNDGIDVAPEVSGQRGIEAEKPNEGGENTPEGGRSLLAHPEVQKLRDEVLGKRGNGITVFEEIESRDGKLKGLKIGNKIGAALYWEDQITGDLGKEDLAFCRKELAEYERGHDKNVMLSKVKSTSDFWEYLKRIGEANPERGVAGYDIKEWMRQAKTALETEAFYRDVYIPLLEILNEGKRSNTPEVKASASRAQTEVQGEPSDGGAGTESDSSTEPAAAAVTESAPEEPVTPAPVAEKVAAAEAEVNTEPTEAQKEAGNYKKGHVQVAGFDITIENPAGSVRKDTDADGKEWSTTMANTYGYIKGTEGVDGDHIDVFLHQNMDEWNGRKVFVVDQTNRDGSFDEHKVMLGFNDKDEAMSAYLANYDKTWADTHPGLRISETNIEDFNKWVQSSHRKTKAFADYSSVSKATNSASDKIESKAESSEKRTVTFREMQADLQGPIGDLFGQYQKEEIGEPAAHRKMVDVFEDYARTHSLPKSYSDWLDRCRRNYYENGGRERGSYKRTGRYKEWERSLNTKSAEELRAELADIEEAIELNYSRYRRCMGTALERSILRKHDTIGVPATSLVEDVLRSGWKLQAQRDRLQQAIKEREDAVFDVGSSAEQNKEVYEATKELVESAGIEVVEASGADASAIAVPEQRPAADLMGDSAAYQERETQTVELVEEIGGVIESRVAMLQLDAESVKPLTMTDVKKMASKYPALKDISDTDLQELVELAMTQLTRSEALINIDGTAEAQRRAFDHIVNLYKIQPSLNARDSERLIKQQYSTPTPFGFVMGQFVRAGGKTVGSMLEPSAGNGALTITVHPSVIHVNDIDDARLANLRKLGYGQVTAQDALLPFSGDKVDVVMTNPPFGTVTKKVYDGVFRISSLEGQMAINALEQMKDDGRAAIVIGGNTSYRTNGSMNPKDAAFFGYLYSHYNVADVINISGKALYSRNGTGYDVRMILIDGRKTGDFQRVFPPVKAKARAEQVTTFDELYKRIQDDIQQIQQVGSQSADVQRDAETTTDGTASATVRTGSNRPNTGAGQRPGTTSNTVRDTPRTDSGQPTPGNDGSRPAGVDNADSGNGTGINNVPRGGRPKSGQPERHNGVDNGRGRSGSDGRGAVASRPDRRAERLEVKPDLTTEKVPYPNQSENGFTLMSVVPAAQAQVLQKSLGEIGDVDQYLVDELGYSSKEELYSYLAAEQVDSVTLAIHQMNKGNAFIIGDMTGVGKGRQGAALIRYAVKQGKVPIYFTQKPTLFTDNYRDLADIGSSDLRPFIIASNPKDANIVDADGNVVHKLPSKKEQERVFNYIMEHGKLPDEYDYVLTTYDQIKNGTADYTQNEDGTWNTEARKLPKKSKGYTTADYNGQARRDALARLAEGNIAILDESHTVGGDSGCGRYMQMLTSSAEGVTFLSATFAKRADNMPIYAQRTAIAEAGVKASELIEAISKGGVTLQEIMSKQLVESGQMIRRERSFEGVTIDWLSVEEEINRRQRQQFNEVADIFNAIRNFQDDYITPIIDAKNEAAAEFGATVGHTQGTKDLGVKNAPFASKMYNLVNQLLFALKVDAVADRVIENLRNGYKPVISFTNTMEGFLSSAPKGVAMDDVPNFSLTLMRALDGVMRFTEKDADENSEGGSISLSELSTEGQNAYNAIRDKIMNLSADLPISPMDAIRMKIEEAGYSVAEITGRTMQLNRTDDGRYVVEARKDRDKKAAMRDFNSGKLDVLMINKSGSTGISLHASSKFEDQRPRVMVFAQFQSDINDEIQMRGRIDRSGQVTRGRYEYIMSTIPAEQRIQMMFKAKLKSLDANTTSSQKSKFNEMEIVDYLNKYGDDVVWEYMKEHPELEERLGDPLDMLQEKNAEDGPRTSEKEDTSKKTGCAGKISRYLAFLSVEEQDEIFREITEAYRVKIQLLDDAGENDLEITTMPLRAETKQKKIWHEGVNPGSGNAFADNTYVEEVEVDVLKKPMKRDEIAEATRKLMGEQYTEKNGGVDWQHYVRAKGDEISLFFQAKADEAVGKLKDAGEARIAKAREKAVTAATKARGRGENNFTDEQIQSLADTVANEEREKEMYKQRKRQEEIMAVKQRIQSLLNCLHAGGIYVVPQDLKQGTAEMFTQTYGTFVGFKFNKSYTLGSSTAIFATLDGRRKVELALSDPAISTIISATEIAYRYSADEIRAISMDNWDSKVPKQTRQKRYIITGNLLQALVDTEKGEKTRGNLISYSTIDGETRQGILMGENFKLTDLRNSASLSSRLAQIREGEAVVSENGDVQISKELYDWRHRGQYELRVPKSKQRGGIYTMHPGLLKLVDGHNFITKGNNMVAYVDEADIAKVVDMLSRAPFNLTVLQESQLSDVSAEEAEDDVLCRPVTDKATLDYLNSESTIKVYRAMQMIDGGLRPPMSAKVDGQLREATEVGVWEEAEEHPEMADENGRFKLDKGNGKSIKAAYNPYIHTSRSPINDQFSSAWSRPELVTVEVEVPVSELTSGYHAEKAKDTVGEKEWKNGPVGRALAKIGQARRVILSRWSRVVRVVPVKEVAEAYAQRLNAHGIEVPFNTIPPALRDALVECGVKIGKPEKGNAGSASLPAYEQWISEQERQRMGDGYGAYSDAEVSFANDLVSKVMGKNRFSKKRQAEFAARERQRMADRVKELAERMHLDNVEVVTDASQLEGKRAKSKGFYNKRTGKITIVIPNNVSTIDAEQTLLHEAVAHYGLRKLFGGHFDTFLDNIYEAAEMDIRRKILDLAKSNGWDIRLATEEYLAGLAEDIDYEYAETSLNGWFNRIKGLFIDMLEKIGFKGFRDSSGVVLTDNELRYILWRSYQNMTEPGRHRSILGEAADIAKQSELKVGNYAERGIEAEYAAEPIVEINNSYNNQIERWESGEMRPDETVSIGYPMGIMRYFMPAIPILLRQKVLSKSRKKHGLTAAEMKNLPEAIAKPIFVFKSNSETISVLTTLKSENGDNLFVAIELEKDLKFGGHTMVVNDILTIHGRETQNIIEPILQNGTLKYVDKEKGLEWLSSASSSYQQEIAKQGEKNLDRLHSAKSKSQANTSQDIISVAKVINSFENPTIEEEELFRPGDFTPRDKVLARDAYERICASGSYQFKEAVQDSMLGLKELYRAILGKKTRIEDVPGFENAYLFENRMSSMNAGEQHEYFQRYMQPLLKEIGRIAGANKRKRKELTDYIMAKHGLERNEYMRNEAAANGEETDRDFAGLMGLTGEADWQSAEDTARQWVDDYESMVDTAALWEAINKATKATLEKVYLSGIISKETYEKILGMYDYYVPLRGWDETTSDQVYGYLTSKNGPLGGSIMKKAEGRKSMADDPIATIGMMADDAIRQGNRNLMKQHFVNFILNHPSDAVSVHDIWLEHNDAMDEWVPVFADIENTDTADEVAQKVESFEQRMEALRTAEPDKYKKGREAQHIPYKVVRGNLREHQILIKRNGRTFVATINGNPRAAQAINGLTNPDVDQNGVVGNMLKAGTWVNRQLSALYTTRNPDFVVGNFFRDMLYSNCMTWVKESPRYALRFHKNFGRFNPIVMRRLLGKWENDTLNMSNRLESLFYQFMKNGGETGYTNVRDIEGHKRAVAAELKKQGSTGRRVWTALGMQLDLLNRSAENCARFAAFVTSRDFGRSIDRAIYDAKEISVNFNKKGSGGKMVNANGQTALGKTGAYLSGGGRLLYVFWNAGIQGMTNFGRQAKLHPAKFSAGATALFTLGYVIPLLAQMLGGGDGDDDDKNAYYNLPEYIRRSNICFYAGDQWITIPLPIEYRAMYGMGELAYGAISGNERYSNSELARQMASQVSQIFPIDMLEGGGGISPFIPSAVKPFTEAYIMNKGWTGLPVYKDTPFNKNDPEWTKAYASADKHLVSFAKWLNETSGGDDFKKGSIDINPAKIEYLLNGTFGGLFTFPNKIKKTGETMFGDRDFEWRNIPIANRLIKSGDERTAYRKLQNEYFKYKDEYESTGRLMRKYENAAEGGIIEYAEKLSFLEMSPGYLRYAIFDGFKDDIDASREAITQETNKEMRANLEAEMYSTMRELVDALHNPESYFKKLHDAGMLDDESVSYLQTHHGMKLSGKGGK